MIESRQEIACIFCLKMFRIWTCSWNIYKLSINIWLQWPCPLTCDLQNLNRSSLSPSRPLYQIWRNSLKAFLRYHIRRIGGPWDLWPPQGLFRDIMFSNMSQTYVTSQWPWPLTFDLPNLISSSLSHSKRKSLKAFLRNCVHKKSGWTYVCMSLRTTWKRNASGPSYRWGGGIIN